MLLRAEPSSVTAQWKVIVGAGGTESSVVPRECAMARETYQLPWQERAGITCKEFPQPGMTLPGPCVWSWGNRWCGLANYPTNTGQHAHPSAHPQHPPPPPPPPPLSSPHC